MTTPPSCLCQLAGTRKPVDAAHKHRRWAHTQATEAQAHQHGSVLDLLAVGVITLGSWRLGSSRGSSASLLVRADIILAKPGFGTRCLGAIKRRRCAVVLGFRGHSTRCIDLQYHRHAAVCMPSHTRHCKGQHSMRARTQGGGSTRCGSSSCGYRSTSWVAVASSTNCGVRGPPVDRNEAVAVRPCVEPGCP